MVLKSFSHQGPLNWHKLDHRPPSDEISAFKCFITEIVWMPWPQQSYSLSLCYLWMYLQWIKMTTWNSNKDTSLCILLWEPLLNRLLGSCIYFEGKYHWVSGVTPATFTPFQCLMMLRGTGVPHSLSLYIHNSGSPRKDKLTGHGRWKHMCDVETLDASVHCTYRGILWLLNDWRFGRLLLFLLWLASKPASQSFIYL